MCLSPMGRWSRSQFVVSFVLRWASVVDETNTFRSGTKRKTHQVIPPRDGLSEFLKDERRARLRQVGVLADDQMPDLAHLAERAAEARDLVVRLRLPVSLRGSLAGGAIIDGHVEALEVGTHADDVGEGLERALDAEGADPAAELGVGAQGRGEEGGVSRGAQDDVPVVQRGDDA